MSTQVDSVSRKVLHLISQIQCEDIRRMRENREFNRQNITVPVMVKFLNGSGEIPCVSRDVSSSGIGLVSTSQIPIDNTCDLEIELESSINTITAKCCWCTPFGNGYFLSGWKF